jgi:hydrogenase nickel incorporation protein HypA/HybF
MHELSLAESILDAVGHELEAYPGARPMRVGVKIGALSAVDVDALRFCFEIALRGSKWPQLKLDAELIPAEAHCLACGHRMRAESTVLDCEHCGSTETVMHGSDELDLTCLEVQRDGNDNAEAESVEREPENCHIAAPTV